MAIHAELSSALNDQANHALNNGAPGTAMICRALIALAEGDSHCGQRIAGWDPATVLRDAMPLRLAGGLHDLFRRGIEPGLGKIYHGEVTSQVTADRLVSEIVARHDMDLLPWFESPPQTNEAGRSVSFVGALHWLSTRVTPNFELNEIGSSAGMNLLIDQYRYDVGGVVSGPDNAPVTIRPKWNGPPPPSDGFTIASVHGCDIQPIDVRDEAAANRLMAYIWPEMPERFERMEAGIKMIRDRPVNLIQADAADFVEARLATPQAAGTTRILMHSIVWQYLPDAVQLRIQTAMAEAGAKATADKPLAWISLETNRATFRHELKVSYWPGGGNDPFLLGEAHAHGIWVNWLMD
jgi:hypothetical protein